MSLAPNIITDESPAISPQVILILGMAGSGKTTFVSRLLYSLQKKNKRTFTINLDPAVKKLPYSPNIDIRDSVEYEGVMRDFELGPNGAIITSLNLFVTKFDQVLSSLESKRQLLDYVIVDTPGQIEVFNWSASGQIIADAFSLSFPTTITYVLDSERCLNPLAFISNLTYVVSVMFKYRLPFILALNKADLIQESGEKKKLGLWLRDFSALLDALSETSEQSSYMTAFAKSLTLALEEFYASVNDVSVSALTGLGFDELIDAKFQAAKTEYLEEFLPEVEEKRQAIQANKEAEAKRILAQFKAKGGGSSGRREDDDYDEAELEKLRTLLKGKKK